MARNFQAARSSIARHLPRHPPELRVISGATCCEVLERGKLMSVYRGNFHLRNESGFVFALRFSMYSIIQTSAVPQIF